MIVKSVTAWTKLLTRVIWLIVVVVIVAALGRHSMMRDEFKIATPTVKSIPQPIDWSAVDAEVAAAMQAADQAADAAANEQLDQWVASLMQRVDDDFLEWYFGYWNQQVLGLKTAGYWLADKLPYYEVNATEQITEEIQSEFAKRVLRPEIAQLELERITGSVLEVWLASLEGDLADISARYEVPTPDWQRYLGEIALVTDRTEANREVPITLKAVVATGAVGTVRLGQALAPVFSRIGARLSPRLAGRATAKLAAKTGGKVAGKAAGKFLGPVVGVGVIVWDVWDHHHTKAVERPILRANMADYLAEVKTSLLYDPDAGIVSVLRSMESNVVASLETRPGQTQTQIALD